jgi:hypothetical protein
MVAAWMRLRQSARGIIEADGYPDGNIVGCDLARIIKGEVPAEILADVREACELLIENRLRFDNWIGGFINDDDVISSAGAHRPRLAGEDNCSLLNGTADRFNDLKERIERLPQKFRDYANFEDLPSPIWLQSPITETKFCWRMWARAGKHRYESYVHPTGFENERERVERHPFRRGAAKRALVMMLEAERDLAPNSGKTQFDRAIEIANGSDNVEKDSALWTQIRAARSAAK